MKIIQNIISVIATLIIAAAVVIFVLLISGIRPYVVMSGSMEPAIMTGSIVFSDTKVDHEKLEVGDIITFFQGDNTVSHRVAGKDEDGYITKGDANETEDANRVPAGEVDGKILYSIPYIGYVIVALRTPTGIAAMISCALFYLIVTVLSDKLKLKEECRNAEES